MKPSKQQIIETIIAGLQADLHTAERAAQTAYETATHEENIAENKYDTLGLEASYLAAGQARRVEEIRLALSLYQKLGPRVFDDEMGVQLGALVELGDANGEHRWLFLGPDGAGLTLQCEGCTFTVITPRSPMGMSLIGKWAGDEVFIGSATHARRFELIDIL